MVMVFNYSVEFQAISITPKWNLLPIKQFSPILLYLCVHAQPPQSCSTLCDLWAIAHQASVSPGFSRQEYWSGLPCLLPGNLPNPGIEPRSPVYPALQMDSLLLSNQGSPFCYPSHLQTLICYLSYGFNYFWHLT